MTDFSGVSDCQLQSELVHWRQKEAKAKELADKISRELERRTRAMHKAKTDD